MGCTRFLLTVLFLVGCGKEPEDLPIALDAPERVEPLKWTEDPELQGFRFELSEAHPGGGAAEEIPPARAEKLSAGETRALLDRAPPFEEKGTEGAAFAFREGSKPPPRTGATVEMPFPPPAKPEVPDVGQAGPLEVLRFAPEGDVPMAPHLSVTFSQPMVAVSSQEEAARVRPVRVEPEPAGQWRWIGAKTVLFEPSEHDRFPMATTYTVTVPEATVSKTGGALEKAVTWTFTTPPPVLQASYPQYGPYRRDPLLFLQFDQAVDPAAMAEHVTLTAKGRQFALQPATEAEIERDEAVRPMVSAAQADRVVVLRPTDLLPAATTFTVTVTRGAPSAEGPNTTTSAQERTFFTYDPLKVTDQYCYEGRKGCIPDGYWSIQFNNPLDEEAFDPSAITIEPAPRRANVMASGASIQIYGDTEAHQTYTVTLPAALADVFGQTLGDEKTVRFVNGGMEPTFQGPGPDFLVLDPAGKPSFPIYTVNHRQMRVRVFRASPQQYAGVSEWMRTWRYEGRLREEPPLERLTDQIVEVKGYVEDERIETSIDLSPWLQDGLGQVLVWVEPEPQAKKRWEQIHVISWVQATRIGLSAYVDYESLLGWATSLEDGSPLEGVELRVSSGTPSAEDPTGTTAANGLATLGLRSDVEGPHLLLARKGNDVAFLPERPGWWNTYGGWTTRPPTDQLRWFTFDDRHMYRPKETVSVKGWVRQFFTGKNGDLSVPKQIPSAVEWVARDPYGNEMTRGETTVSDTGGFHFTFDLPETPNLGWASVQITAKGSPYTNVIHHHGFQIQEFRRPEFEVSANADPGPYYLGEHAVVTVSANYFAGGTLPGAPVHWEAWSEPATFQPPDWSEFRFGTWTPWWRIVWWAPPSPYGGAERKTLEGQTDPMGEHHVRLDFLSVNPPRPTTVHTEATVTDVNRQGWTARHQVLVHPAAWYVGVRPARSFVELGQSLDLDLILVDVDGTPISGQRVETTLARLEWERVKGEWKEVEKDPVSCVATSAAEPVPCTFTPEEGGSYVLRAEVRDLDGRPNQTEVRLWVSGGKGRPSRGVEMEEITLIPDKDEYQPGDVAEVLVQAPFHPAEGLWTLQRDGLVYSERFAVEGSTVTLNVPITDAHVPNVHLDVDLVGTAERTDDDGKPLPDVPRQVAHGHGALNLPVPPHRRALAVTVTPQKAELQPGGQTVVELRVAGADGAPVQAEVALVAVDESVLSLSGYRVPDPLEVFYSQLGAGVVEYHLRSYVQLAKPEEVLVGGPMGALGYGAGEFAEDEEVGFMARGGSGNRTERRALRAPMTTAMPPPAPPGEPAAAAQAASDKGLDFGGEAAGEPIALREDFAATALFAPRVRTGADGRAEVQLDLPDSLTRYRLMAVAVEGGRRFGHGEATVTARLPVMLRPSPPRFLNFGDRMELPLVVQNQTDAPRSVSVAIEAINARVIDDVSRAPEGEPVRIAGRRMMVAAKDRVEVRIPVAAEMAGTARFQAVVAADSFADATRFEFPVWTPATAEAFATYGVIDEGVEVQPVKAPDAVWTQFGGLEVTTSSTTLQALTDAVIYLVQYPYECNEQISSRLMAVAALRDVLDAFQAEQLPPPEELEAAVARDIERLKVRQAPNGGFGWWRYNERDWPYPSVHVAHALARAKAKGYEVPQGMVDGSLGYLRHIERHIPGWYSKESRWTIIAYAVYVRHLFGEEDPGKARSLLREAGVEALPFEAQGWILPVLHAAGATAEVAEIERHLGNNVAETAAGAHFVTSYSDGEYVLLHSNRRVDGVLLEALIATDPESDLIPKLVQGLLAHRTRGRWGNTQENAFVLLAMDAYFQAYESQTPDFVARVWLGEGFAGEHAFQGRSTDYAHLDIPMGFLTDPPGEKDLTIAKEGQGRLYYRVGMRYAPRDLFYEAADYGFAVERTYAAIDDPQDVRRDADGTWHIRAGSRVRVRLTMVAPARRYHVALVDPLPAGLEALNPALAVTATLPEDPEAQGGSYWWWRGPWYEHQNMRDERVEAYTSLLWDGVYTYSYVASATTPGQFVVPPTKAEEMYTPETFGRSGSDRVIVE